jgi:5'(3')-deoxyribonucleotidase
MDNTIVNSTKAFCSVYNELYKLHPQFELAKWELVNTYSFKDQCPLIDEVEEIFKEDNFFNHLEFIDDNAYEVIQELTGTYQVIIVSIGTYENISLKSLWVQENLPFIKDSIFIINDGVKMDKSLINMQNGIFIDDLSCNLFSSNATYKICFGKLKEWNENWKFDRCFNWLDVREKLLQ